MKRQLALVVGLLLNFLVLLPAVEASPVSAEAAGRIAQRIVVEGILLESAGRELALLGASSRQSARFWGVFSDLRARGALRPDTTDWTGLAALALDESSADSALVRRIADVLAAARKKEGFALRHQLFLDPPSAEPGISFVPNRARVRGTIVRVAEADVSGATWARVRIDTADNTLGQRARIASLLEGRTEWILLPPFAEWDEFRRAGIVIEGEVILTLKETGGPNVFRFVGTPLAAATAVSRPMARLTVTAPFTGNRQPVETLRDAINASTAEWNVEEITLTDDRLEKAGPATDPDGRVWKLVVEADSEGIFRAAEVACVLLGRATLSYRYLEQAYVEDRGQFTRSSSAAVHAFTFEMGGSIDPAVVIAAYAARGLKLRHLSGASFSGEGTRQKILLLARDHRVMRLQLAVRVQPTANP